MVMINTAKNGLIVLALLVATGVQSQAAVAIPGPADTGRLQENQSPLPVPAPVSRPKQVSPPTMPPPIPEGAQDIHFVLNNLSFTGNTVYPASVLTNLYTPIKGQSVSLSQIYEVAQTITQKYHDDGFVLAKAVVPAQDMADGNVRIDIFEGYVHQVQVSGAYEPNRIAQGIIDRIKKLHPLNTKALEKNILLLNDLFGTKAKAVLGPVESDDILLTPGGVDIQIVFERTPASASIQYSNYNSKYFNHYRTDANAYLADTFLPYDQTHLNFATANRSKDLLSTQFEYKVPLFSAGPTLATSFAYAKSHPGRNLSDLDIDGTSYEGAVTLSQTLRHSREENLSAFASFRAKNIETDSLNAPLFYDKLRILEASTEYSFRDPWDGSTLSQLKLSQGINGLGASDNGSPKLSSESGRTDFTALSYNAGHIQPLAPSWSLYSLIQGQIALDHLLSSEQFGFGGQYLGRGFASSQIKNDDGFAFGTELRYRLPNFYSDLNLEPFAFYDWGSTWANNSFASASAASSIGIGLRMAFLSGISGDFSVARPLALKTSGVSDKDIDKINVFFSLAKAF